MALKIIGGTARGVPLETPDDRALRPTAGRAREALFCSLGDWSGKRVIDAYAGSGAVGLEAASRGAAAVGFIEKAPAHAALIERNVAKVRKTGAEFTSEVLCGEVNVNNLRRLAPADWIFFDPPYAEAAAEWSKLLSDERFRTIFSKTAIVFEVPDFRGAAGPLLSAANAAGLTVRLRTLGGTEFLTAVLP